MAQRRMFSKGITNSSGFLMMPPTSQLLYIHLGMNADDDGFCEHFSIMRMVEAKPDDLRVLALRGFVKVFDDKVLIITQWKENNYIQKDRYTPSKYLEIYSRELLEIAQENQNLSLPGIAETPCIQDVYKVDTQVRLGKGRIERPPRVTSSIKYLSAIPPDDINEFVRRFDISRSKVLSVAEDLVLYCQSKGKVYKDYKSFLLKAIKRDHKERPTPAPQETQKILTPEQEAQNKIAFAEHKKKMAVLIGKKTIQHA